jgi:hypothetical protein
MNKPKNKKRRQNIGAVARFVCALALLLTAAQVPALAQSDRSAAVVKQSTTPTSPQTNSAAHDESAQLQDQTQPDVPRPLHVAVLFDVSSSHANDRIKNAKTAVNSFLSSLHDQVGDVVLVLFGDRARIVARSPLSDSKKVQLTIDAVLANESWTDHLGAFALGESQVISHASEDNGKAIILMLTDRQVSPPPKTVKPEALWI